MHDVGGRQPVHAPTVNFLFVHACEPGSSVLCRGQTVIRGQSYSILAATLPLSVGILNSVVMQETREDVLFGAFGSSALKETFDVDKLRTFLISAKVKRLNVVIITSGGTAVPLERSAVRFIENFSQGTRGAASAEKFLEYGENVQDAQEGEEKRYAVVFLTRKGSRQPYTRNFDFSTLAESCSVEDGKVILNSPKIAKAVSTLKAVQDRLFSINFQTVQEYLADLRSIAKLVEPFGTSAMFYLAAAVSDFFVRESDLPKHKIQSSGEGLKVHLEPVPKCLGLLHQEWAPKAFLVSFKVS